MAKHDAQAMVASFDSQNLQRGESDEMAAPQFGQFRVAAFIADPGAVIAAGSAKLNIAEASITEKIWVGELRLK